MSLVGSVVIISNGRGVLPMSAPKRLPQQIDNLATIYSYIRIVFFFIHLNINIVFRRWRPSFTRKLVLTDCCQKATFKT